jgi:3-oxoacyl-[acyl-carrier-protein] synthase I
MSASLSGPRSMLTVAGHHVVSSVGLDAGLTCAAIRAGVARFAEHPFFHPRPPEPETGEPVSPLIAAFAPLPGLDPETSGVERMLELARAALEGLMREVGLMRRQLARTALLIALPTQDDVVARWDLRENFAAALLARAGLAGLAEVLIDQSGHTGALALTLPAGQLLQSGRVDHCVVLAVDSLLSLDRLAALDAVYRLKSLRGVDGIIPGEAAVALLLERADSPAGRRALARLGPLQAAVESQPFTSVAASTGVALSAVLRSACAEAPPLPVSWLLADLNGESYRAHEWGLARARLGSQLRQPLRLVHPADCLGEVGAAIGGVLLSCAIEGFARGRAPDTRAVLFAGADDGARVAMTVHPPDASPLTT